ncbi:hypothetical protein SCUP234_01347 [Seiridium cupressi]
MDPTIQAGEPFYISYVYPCGLTEQREHREYLLESMEFNKLAPCGQDITRISIHLNSNDHCSICRDSETNDRTSPHMRHTYVCGHDEDYVSGHSDEGDVLSPEIIACMIFVELIPRGQENPFIEVQASYCAECQRAPFGFLRAALERSGKVERTPPAQTTVRTHFRFMYEAHLTGKLSDVAYDELLTLVAQACINLVPDEEFNAWVRGARFDEYIVSDLRSAITTLRLG